MTTRRRDVNVVSGIVCPSCKQPTVECRYWDNGGGSYCFDNFVHICTNLECSHLKEVRDQYGGQSPYEDPYPNCPFCRRNAIAGNGVQVDDEDRISNPAELLPIAQS